MITADTITDEQIRALSERSTADRDHENKWWSAHRHLWAPGSIKIHDDLIKLLHETISMCASALNPQCHIERRTEARAHCAEILNARKM
jgi:hypothetical protein